VRAPVRIGGGDQGWTRPEARSADSAERVTEATAAVGQAAQDLVGVVVTGIAERIEEQLRAVRADLTSAVGAQVEAASAGSRPTWTTPCSRSPRSCSAAAASHRDRRTSSRP
jgi:hypothetical protein